MDSSISSSASVFIRTPAYDQLAYRQYKQVYIYLVMLVIIYIFLNK